MNHIARLTTERADAIEQLRDAPGADFVHVRTDMLPKLARVRSALLTA